MRQVKGSSLKGTWGLWIAYCIKTEDHPRDSESDFRDILTRNRRSSEILNWSIRRAFILKEYIRVQISTMHSFTLNYHKVFNTNKMELQFMACQCNQLPVLFNKSQFSPNHCHYSVQACVYTKKCSSWPARLSPLRPRDRSDVLPDLILS
jgi:hypothetical protein